MTEKQLDTFLTSNNPDVRALAAEIIRLIEAIKKHRDNTGHELCWMNDEELWKVLGERKRYPHETLPVREEFLKQCAKFYESRLKGTAYVDPRPTKTVAE